MSFKSYRVFKWAKERGISLLCYGAIHYSFLKAKASYKKPRFLLTLWDLAARQGGCTLGHP